MRTACAPVRWILWRVLWGVIALLGSTTGVQARESSRSPSSAQDGAAVNKLLSDARGALGGGDAERAYRLAAQAYRSTGAPEALFLLGQAALAGNRLLAAQDLLRRYLADPNLEVSADSPDLLTAQNIVARQRPPAAQLNITGDRGMLISIDDRLVGVLPLVRPLLLAPGEHRVVLERRGTRLEDLVRVAVGRLGELRVNAATKALVLTVLPGVLLRQSLPGLPAAEVVGFEQTLEAGLAARRLSALSERDSAECGEPAPGACSDPLRCEVDQARHCEADYVLRTRLEARPGTPPQRELFLDLIDVNIGAVAATAVVRCSGCVATALREQVRGQLAGLLERGIGRGRGTLDVASDPAAALVLIDGQIVGVTPFRGPVFAGPHQISLRKDGHSEFSQPVEVRDGETAQVIGTLSSLSGSAAPPGGVIVLQPPGRPLWRLLVGGVAVGSGAVLLGFGASALAIDGRCVGSFASLVNCPTVYNTDGAGGALLGLAVALIAGGSVAIALPPPHPKTASSATEKSAP